MMCKGIFIIFLVFAASVTRSFASSKDICSDALKKLVDNTQVTHQQLQRFLRLQADLTLHKLTYSLYRNEISGDRFKIEDEIITLSNQMNSKDPDFLAVKKSFESNPLSRTHLASIMPFLKDIINSQINEEDPVKRKLFMIGMNDLKILSVLTEGEFKLKNGRFDNRFVKGHASTNSILNLLRIINDAVTENKAQKEKTKEIVKKKMQSTQKEMIQLIDQINLPSECQALYSNCKIKNNDQPIIDERFLSLMLEVADQAAGFHRSRYLRYGNVGLDLSGAKKSDDIKKDTNNDKVLPAIINNQTDADVVRDYLIQHVLDHLPYFVTRQDLEKDRDLLYSLARAIDAGVLAEKDREKRIFKYKGDSYYLPELWNDSYQNNRMVKRFKDRFNKFVAIPFFDAVNDDEFEFKIPEEIPKDEKADFERVRNEQFYMFEHKVSFEFKGRLYDINTGKLIPSNLQGLLKYKKGFIKNNGGEDFTATAELDVRKSKAIKNNERSYIMDDEVYHISGQPVNLDKEYERYKVKFKNDNISVNDKSKAKSLPSKQQILDLEQVEPQKYALVIKAIADKKRSFTFNDQVYDLYSQNPFQPINQVQALTLYNDYRNNSGLTPLNSTTSENIKAVLNDDLTYEENGNFYHTLSGRKITSRTNITEVENGYYEHDQIYTKELLINDLSNEEILKNYFQSENAKECKYHSVIDKKSGELKVYSSDIKEVYSTEVLLGQSGDSYKNYHTPAGIIYSQLNLSSTKSKTPRIKMTGLKDSDIEQLVALNNQNSTDNRQTNGDIKLPENKLSEYKNTYYDEDCPLYILPDSDELKFQLRDGKLEFVAKDNTQYLGDFYLQENKDFAPKEIKVSFEEIGFENEVSKKFVKTLETQKKDLMQKLNLSNGEYNELVKMAVAVLGVESGFGTESAYEVKESKIFNMNIGQALVTMIKMNDATEDSIFFGKGSLGDAINPDSYSNSRGLTQIKNVREFLKNEYPDITEEDLNKPENAAIATMFVLVQKYKTLEYMKSAHPAINETNKFDYLYYIYSGSNHRISTRNATPVMNSKSQELISYASKIKVLTK